MRVDYIELFIGIPLHLVLSLMSHLKAKRTYDEAARYLTLKHI